MKTYEALPGDHIKTVFERMGQLAQSAGEEVISKFNGKTISIKPGDDAYGLYKQWEADRDAEHEAWKASPEGIASAKRQEEAQAKAEAAKSEGYLPFAIRDQAVWEAGIAAQNGSDYGLCCYRYAARWANLMEARMKDGASVEGVADKASHDADLEGISGFMYGCAVSILARADRAVVGEEV